MANPFIRAARLTQFNSPLVVDQTPLPPPAADEICVRVLYAGINFYENLILLGKYPSLPQLPAGVGGECLGEVLAVGDDVTGFKLSDRVVTIAQTGFGTSGTFAEKANIKARYAFKAPTKVEEQRLAPLPMAYFTAWLLANNRVQLGAEKTVLIHSAAGGVGLALLDLLKTGTWGKLNVIGTCSGEAKAALLKKRKIDYAIDITKSNWREETLSLFPGGVDVVFDAHGAAYYEDNLSVLKPNSGQMCSFGAYSGPITDAGLVSKLRQKNLTLSGFLMWPLIEDRNLCEDVFAALFALAEKKKINPQIDQVFSLENANDAFERLRSRKSIGKILVSPMNG
jgi:NADPH:quinone reductase